MQDQKGADIGSRSVRTLVYESKQGFRAYGVVVARRSPEGACTNSSTVYTSEPAGMFRAALRQLSETLPGGTIYDGNGIENIQWSPSGARLLIEFSQWTWGTDSTWHKKYILLTQDNGHFKELPVTAAIQRHFAHPCAWLVSSKGWLDEARIDIELSPFKDVDEEGVADPTPSCVGTPTHFSFDVDFGDFLTGTGGPPF